MRKIIILLGVITVVSCKKETETLPLTTEDSIPKTIVSQPDRTENDSLATYVSMANRNRKIAELGLATATPEKANELYERLYNENEKILNRLNKFEGNLLDTYYEHFSGEETAVPDKEITAKAATLKKGGLEFWDVGEGMAEIRTEADYYKNIFSDKVTNDYREFINMETNDNRELWQADAAVVIPWQDLGERVINWENFLARYPESKLRRQASYLYEVYRYGFLVGFDNTMVIDRISNDMTDETKAAFLDFAKKYPESPTTKYVKMLLENPTNTDTVANAVRIDF